MAEHEPGPLARGWAAYATLLVEGSATPEEAERLRLAYFAGASSALGAVATPDLATYTATVAEVAREILKMSDHALLEVLGHARRC